VPMCKGTYKNPIDITMISEC